jgi:hypothetical protein
MDERELFEAEFVGESKGELVTVEGEDSAVTFLLKAGACWRAVVVAIMVLDVPMAAELCVVVGETRAEAARWRLLNC